MAGFWTNLGSSISNTFSSWRRVYADPTEVTGGAILSRPQWYNLLWGYYVNSAFEYIPNWGNQWSSYKQAYRLYRQMRSLYNPTSRLVDFYSGQVYPGILTTDGAALPHGVQSAITFSDDTPAELVNAVAQVWRWSNWQSNKSQMIRYAAATGNTMVEIDDLVDEGKVALRVVWPGLIKSLDFDHAGNIKGYVMEYGCRDDSGLFYTYRKEVTPDSFKFFKNGQPHDYDGSGAEYPNPYGFVPAVWVKHRDLGSDFGAPVIHGSIGKIDELNSLASHIHDHIHRVIGAPAVMWTTGDVTRIGQTAKRPASDEWADPEVDRDAMFIMKGPAGGKVDSLIHELDLAGAGNGLDRLIAEIEADHPELAMYRELRAMSAVTGPAASRMMGDVVQLVAESAANYDLASTRLFGMAVAIGGFRANGGFWDTGKSLTVHQQAFLPFGLDSYGDGGLDMTILPRPLIPLTQMEQIELQQAEQSLKNAQVQMAIQLRESAQGE